MKGGGGLTWAGWLMIGVGGMLVYAGMTGQSLMADLGAVLSGRSPQGGKQTNPIVTAPATPGSSGQSGLEPGGGYAGSGAGGSSSGSTGAPHPATIPNPTYGGSW